MDDVVALRAEVERLRDLLLENGIDPEPYVPPPEKYGPPTLFEHTMRKMTAKFFAHAVARFMEPNPILADMPIGPIRIRLPTDYSVTR